MCTPQKIDRFRSRCEAQGEPWMCLVVLAFLSQGQPLPVRRSLLDEPLENFDYERVAEKLKSIAAAGFIVSLECEPISCSIAFDLP